MSRFRCALWLAALGVVLTATGCSPSRIKVAGDVTLEGKALPKVMVTLTPVDGKGRPCSGLTDDNGHFELLCDGKDGVPPGEYKVTFAATSGDKSIDNFKPDPNIDPAKRVKEFQDKARKDVASAKQRGESIHGNYSVVTSTPFTLKVPPAQQPVKFNLKNDGSGG
jgi:hypothetical protein